MMRTPAVGSQPAVRGVLPSGLDPVQAYRMMVRMRLVDEALVAAWADGLVPGEYHSAIGEEGVNAGVLLHLSGMDAVALDHRNTAPFIGRGADPAALMLEVLGCEEGMNQGWAGHMHLLDPALHAVSDGIVGAAAPLAVGNAVANTRLRPGAVAVAFHGEAAMNQGMLLESYNLAVAWNLPVVFVCKDNRWSITTYSREVTGGRLRARARAFGLATAAARGDRVDDVFTAAGRLLARAREGKGPGFLHVTCHRPGGHFEGDPLVRILEHPGKQAAELAPGLVAGVRASTGGGGRDRAHALALLALRIARAGRDRTVRSRMDPLRRGRALVDEATAVRIDAEEHAEIDVAVGKARAAVGARPTFGRAEA